MYVVIIVFGIAPVLLIILSLWMIYINLSVSYFKNNYNNTYVIISL